MKTTPLAIALILGLDPMAHECKVIQDGSATRRTGRTTRMIICALSHHLNNPEEFITIVGHSPENTAALKSALLVLVSGTFEVDPTRFRVVSAGMEMILGRAVFDDRTWSS